MLGKKFLFLNDTNYRHIRVDTGAASFPKLGVIMMVSDPIISELRSQVFKSRLVSGRHLELEGQMESGERELTDPRG